MLLSSELGYWNYLLYLGISPRALVHSIASSVLRFSARRASSIALCMPSSPDFPLVLCGLKTDFIFKIQQVCSKKEGRRRLQEKMELHNYKMSQ